MFLFNQIGVGNMLKTILITTLLLLGSVSVVEASTSTNSYGHKVKMSKFRVQKETLYNVTQNSTIAADEAAAIIGVESGWNVTVKNKEGSSATGLFQYIDDTWVKEKRLFAKQANIPKNAKRTDAKANITIGVMGLERNKQILSAKLGIPQDNLALGDLYIAHFLGSDRAVKVLNGNPNALMSKYVKIKKANRGLFLTSKGKVRTVQQFRIAMNQKLERERSLYKKEIMNYQLTKLIERVDDKQVVINFQPQPKWYEPKQII